MSTLSFPAHRVRRSYSGATEDWLASAAGKAVIVDSGDVWGVVVSQTKSTSKLPVYTLAWLYDSKGQRPEGGKAVTVDPSQPDYASFVEQLRTEGTVVSLSDGTEFASSRRSSPTTTPALSAVSQRTYATQGSRSEKRRGQVASGAQPTSGSETPFWKNPWVLGGGAVLTLGGIGTAVWFARRKKRP